MYIYNSSFRTYWWKHTVGASLSE